MNAPSEFVDLPVAISRIERSPTNPRETFDDESQSSLTESIKRHGVLQPILLRPWPAAYQHALPIPDYELVAGERRWRSAKAAGLEHIPAKVRDLTDKEVLEIQIIENLQREDLHPIEEAIGYERMMQDYGYTADLLAEQIGKSKAYIYARAKLTALCHTARKAFREGKLTPSTALLVARIPTTSLQEQATKEITDPNFRGEIMSYRSAKDHIHSRYMLRLVEAPFPTTDADLLKKVGSCTACPKRTGNQPADLFADVESADVCTDPDCHQQKRQAHVNRVAAEAEANGRKVIKGKDAEKLMPYSHSVEGHTRIDDRCYFDSKGRTYRELLATQSVEPVLVEDTKKNVLVECVPDKQLAAALKAAGIRTGNEQRKEEQKKTNAAVEKERSFRAALFTETRDAIRADYDRNGARLTDDDMRIVALKLFRNIGNDLQIKLLKHYLEGKIEYEQIDAFKQQISSYSGADLCLLLIDMALIGETVVNEYSMKNKPENLLAMAESSGVNPAEIKSRFAEKAREKVSPPSKAAQAGKSDAAKKPAEKPAVVTADDAEITPLAIGDSIRINTNVRSPIGAAHIGKTGIVNSSIGDRAFMVEFDGHSTRVSFDRTELVKISAAKKATDKPAAVKAAKAEPETDELAIGDSVQVKDGLKTMNGHLRKCSGRKGVVEALAGGCIHVRFAPGNNGLITNLVRNEVRKLPGATKAAPAAVKTKTKKNSGRASPTERKPVKSKKVMNEKTQAGTVVA